MLVLLNHAWMPWEPAIIAGMISDWVNALCDLPFEAVDRACIRWLSNPDNVDERGRQIRPATGQIRYLALDERDRIDARSKRFLPRTEKPTPTSWDGLKRRISCDRWNIEKGGSDGLRRIESEVGDQIRNLRLDRPDITVAEAFASLSDTPMKPHTIEVQS